jgi:CheY-like chemotaxis protein
MFGGRLDCRQRLSCTSVPRTYLESCHILRAALEWSGGVFIACQAMIGLRRKSCWRKMSTVRGSVSSRAICFAIWGITFLRPRGLEAWHQARTCEGRIDILIAEQNLPFMDGLELAAHVRKLFPSVKVLLILQETTASCRVSPSLAVLHEPIEYSVLMNKLHSLLRTHAAAGSPM